MHFQPQSVSTLSYPESGKIHIEGFYRYGSSSEKQSILNVALILSTAIFNCSLSFLDLPSNFIIRSFLPGRGA